MPDQLAGDHEQDDRLELNSQIFADPAVTMFFRMPDDSMKSIKVYPGDMLVVDRSLEPRDGQFVVVVINGEQVVRRVIVRDGEVFIKPHNGVGEFVRIGVPGAELIGVAKAFIPVIAEQDSSLSAFALRRPLSDELLPAHCRWRQWRNLHTGMEDHTGVSCFEPN